MMHAQLVRDDFNSHAVLDPAGEPLQRLVLDFEDLVDWAADLSPRVRRVRDAAQAPYLVTAGLAALLAVGAVLLMTRVR